ncbi:uncharacterized protein LOC106656477 [Trichogramma pretiosum]|uniref:uncharacterized protein LOC106656477 n=1 Tax=Trichogramma pretiosum TaxID=7493 RepID=UPI000C718A41|nr:uncharacterized protein LOC106656477 [Trichogramma pretiosum]
MLNGPIQNLAKLLNPSNALPNDINALFSVLQVLSPNGVFVLPETPQVLQKSSNFPVEDIKAEPLDLSVHEKIPYISNDNKLVIDRAAIGDRQSERNFNYSLGISSTQTTQISTAQSSSSEREINKRTYKNYSPEQLLLAIKTVAEQKMSPTAAAEANGIPSRTLYDKLTKYGIPTPKKRKSDKVTKPISSRGKNP